MLMQQRRAGKCWGGMWGLTAGGHGKSGESRKEAILRQTKE